MRINDSWQEAAKFWHWQSLPPQSYVAYEGSQKRDIRQAIEMVLADYPQLTREDVMAAIAYGAEVARERIIPIPVDRVA